METGEVLMSSRSARSRKQTCNHPCVWWSASRFWRCWIWWAWWKAAAETSAPCLGPSVSNVLPSDRFRKRDETSCCVGGRRSTGARADVRGAVDSDRPVDVARCGEVTACAVDVQIAKEGGSPMFLFPVD